MVRSPARRLLLLTLGTVCAVAPAIRGAAAPLPGPIDPAPDAGRPPLVELPSPVGALTYTPGRGLRVGDTRLTLGGYAAVDLLRDEGGPAKLKVDELSFFFIVDPAPRVHLFSELELVDLVTVDDRGRGGTVEHRVIAERLYGDVALSDQLNVRVGKFLTPIGRWNVIHAPPLVWTTSRPLPTLLAFDRNTTGAMLFGSLLPYAPRLTYSVFGQFVNSLDRPSNEAHPADRSAGVRLEYTLTEAWSVGSSYMASTHQAQWDHLVGLDTLWQGDGVELMGEAVAEDGTGPLEPLWGLYLQSAVEVLAGTYLVGRYEHFDQRAPAPQVNLVVLGVAYKPAPYVVLKAEYLIADHRAAASPPGVKCSFAILF